MARGERPRLKRSLVSATTFQLLRYNSGLIPLMVLLSRTTGETNDARREIKLLIERRNFFECLKNQDSRGWRIPVWWIDLDVPRFFNFR